MKLWAYARTSLAPNMLSFDLHEANTTTGMSKATFKANGNGPSNVRNQEPLTCSTRVSQMIHLENLLNPACKASLLFHIAWFTVLKNWYLSQFSCDRCFKIISTNAREMTRVISVILHYNFFCSPPKKRAPMKKILPVVQVQTLI